MGSTDEPYLVAAIDFGSTHSSYAMSYRHDYLKDPLNVTTTVWPGNMDLYTQKTPTVILLDQNLEFVSFGYEAQDVYADKATDKEHEDYRLFQHFTLPFCNPEVEIDDDWTIMDSHDVEAPAVVVITEVLKYYHRHLQSTIVKHTGHEENHPVRWVIVVPTTWNESARDLLLTACNHAGFDGEHTFIADASDMVLLHSKHIKPPNNVMTRGNRIMTVDLGGGGAELCVYDVWNDKEVEIAHKQYHTCLGSRILNDLLIVFLAEMFKVDYEKLKEAISSNHVDYIELMRNFEAIKRLVGDDSFKPITLKLPMSFKDHIRHASGLTLEEALTHSELQNCVSLVKGSIRMDRQVIDLVFKDLIKQTINIITKLDNRFTKNNTNITHIILTGGFSECKLLQSEMKQRIHKVQTPNDSGVSALKGAVIYGHNLEAISCLNTTENSVYSLDEFLNSTEGQSVNEISAIKRKLQSGLQRLQEKYEEEYQSMCGIDPDMQNDDAVQTEEDDETVVVLYRDSTMGSQPFEVELERQEEGKIQGQTEEELKAQQDAEELDRIEKELEQMEKELEAENQRRKEMEAQRKREGEEFLKRRREAEEQRQREEEAELKRQREAAEQREREAEERKQRAIEHQRGLAAAAERRRQEELEKKKKKSSVCNIL